VDGLSTQGLLYHKHYVCVQTVNSRSHDIRFKNSVEEFRIFLHVSWNVMNPLGPLMSFTYNIFLIIQSVNMSTFPWYLMWLLFHNKVGTGTEGSWQFKSSHVFNTEFEKWEVIICNPLKARLFRFEKKHKYLSPKGATVFLGTWLHLSSACAWNSRPTHCSKNAACICFKSIMLSPPSSKAPQTTVLFTFSKALRLQSFLRHK